MTLSTRSVTGLILAAALASACTTTPKTTEPVAVQAPVVQSDIQYIVSRGERLAGISHTLTGSQNNWQAIADFNNISNPRLLKSGTVLTIPGYLLSPTDLSTAVASEAASAPVTQKTTVVASQQPNPKSSQSPDKRVRGGKIVVYQPTALPGPKKVKVKTARVDVNRKFEQNRTKIGSVVVSSAGDSPDIAPDNRSEWVLVVGSYYPKGVYQKPDSTSRILVRVAPGSRLRLGGRTDGWLQVETDKGIGYIRTADAEILAARPVKRLVAGV